MYCLNCLPFLRSMVVDKLDLASCCWQLQRLGAILWKVGRARIQAE